MEFRFVCARDYLDSRHDFGKGIAVTFVSSSDVRAVNVRPGRPCVFLDLEPRLPVRLTGDLIRDGAILCLMLGIVCWVSACGGDGATELPPPSPYRAPTAIGTIPAQTVLAGETVTIDTRSYFTDGKRAGGVDRSSETGWSRTTSPSRYTTTSGRPGSCQHRPDRPKALVLVRYLDEIETRQRISPKPFCPPRRSGMKNGRI